METKKVISKGAFHWVNDTETGIQFIPNDYGNVEMDKNNSDSSGGYVAALDLSSDGGLLVVDTDGNYTCVLSTGDYVVGGPKFEDVLRVVLFYNCKVYVNEGEGKFIDFMNLKGLSKNLILNREAITPKVIHDAIEKRSADVVMFSKLQWQLERYKADNNLVYGLVRALALYDLVTD